MGSTNSGPQSGIFAHTMPGWCNLEDQSLILNHPYHEYGYAILIRARGSLLVAPPYPEGCFIVHLRHSRPTWTTHCCKRVEPSALGEFVTTTPPLPGIAYNAIMPTYHNQHQTPSPRVWCLIGSANSLACRHLKL
jgi:hypothetical protein